MRRSNFWRIAVLGIAVLAVSACSNSDIDDPDHANALLQILDVNNPKVSGQTTTGTCTVDGDICLDNSDCTDGADPLDSCFINPASIVCQITEWSATVQNAAKTDLAGASPFNDIILQDVTIAYDWVNGFVMPSYTVPLSGTVLAGESRQVTFFPISAEDLGDLRDFAPAVGRTANVTLTFRGVGEDGDPVARSTGSQLAVDPCN